MAKKKQKKQQAGAQFLSPEQFMKQRVRSLEIGKCYISEDIEEYGEGHVVVSRKHTGGRISVAFYLVDIFCLGVKDSFYHLRLEEEELNNILEKDMDVRVCAYEEAHNWIYGAISWAEEAGIEPDKSFAVTQYMLEEDTDEIPLIEYEYGRDGKHFLVANDNLEASRYLPLLDENLGEGNYTFVVRTDIKDLDLGPDEMIERLKHASESPLFKKYGPNTQYTYHHPDYPATLQLEGPEWLFEELRDTSHSLYLPDEVTDRILALPRDTVRHDLEQIVLYHMGQTCDGIPDDYDPDGYAGTISHCIFLLGELGNEDSSLDVVLEVLRQSSDFTDYHFGDSGDEVFVPTLYLLGQNKLEKLMNFVKEEGLETFCKCYIFPAVANVALLQPERRDEVVAWFREVIQFATKMLPKTQWFDANLAGLMLYSLLDIQAKELLPDIRKMFATKLVDLGVCGDFATVSRLMYDPREKGDPNSCITEIHERFADMKRRWDR
jgi:hypothetical protein